MSNPRLRESGGSQKWFRHRSVGMTGTGDELSLESRRAVLCSQKGSVHWRCELRSHRHPAWCCNVEHLHPPGAVTVSQSQAMSGGENLTCTESRVGGILMFITAVNAFCTSYFINPVNALNPEVLVASQPPRTQHGSVPQAMQLLAQLLLEAPSRPAWGQGSHLHCMLWGRPAPLFAIAFISGIAPEPKSSSRVVPTILPIPSFTAFVK